MMPAHTLSIEAYGMFSLLLGIGAQSHVEAAVSNDHLQIFQINVLSKRCSFESI